MPTERNLSSSVGQRILAKYVAKIQALTNDPAFIKALEAIEPGSQGAATKRQALLLIANRRHGDKLRLQDYDKAEAMFNIFLAAVVANHGINSSNLDGLPDEIIDEWFERVADSYGYMTTEDFRQAASGQIFNGIKDAPQHYGQLSEKYVFAILEAYEQQSRTKMALAIRLLADHSGQARIEAPRQEVDPAYYQEQANEVLKAYQNQDGGTAYQRAKAAMGVHAILIRSHIFKTGSYTDDQVLAARQEAINVQLKETPSTQELNRYQLNQERERLQRLKEARAIEDERKREKAMEKIQSTALEGAQLKRHMTLAETALVGFILEAWTEAGLTEAPPLVIE